VVVDITELLAFSVKNNASDLHLSAGLPPLIRVDGEMRKLNVPALDHKQVHGLVYEIMNDMQRKEYEENLETDFSFEVKGLSRFRVNAFVQNRGAAAVLRTIPSDVLTLDDLGAPDIFKEIINQPTGIVLVTGATGSGKSTTLAAMVDHINTHKREHILTIEDPIEFVHQHRGCIVTQREVGIDTESFEVALKNMLRQAPDVIMIGEIRTREAMEQAITFAETGHLCLCTLHANNANQALDRILHFFPAERHQQLWMDLSLNLKAMVAQQLIPTRDGQGRRACVEILLNTPLASDLIRKGDVSGVKDLMRQSTELGMQTFDQALYDLYTVGEITYEDAIAHADSANDLRLLIKLGADNNPEQMQKMAGGLTMQEDGTKKPPSRGMTRR